MKAKSIAIITPSFNQGKYIERTIKSVLNQDVFDLDYVVIDGGSTDETLSILKKYNNKLRYLSEPDRGQAHAVNKGIMMTSSDVIGWLNSDDVYYPNVITQVLDFFLKNPSVDIVYGKANYIDESDQVIEPYPTQHFDFKALQQTCFIAQPAVFFRRRIIERVGLLNEKLQYCMDYEYWLRLTQAGLQFVYLEELVAGSRLYPETKTMRAPQSALAEALQMLHTRLSYVPEDWILNDAISFVKGKTHVRTPQLRFLFYTYFQAVRSSFRWNGWFKGLFSCLLLPGQMWQRRANSD